MLTITGVDWKWTQGTMSYTEILTVIRSFPQLKSANRAWWFTTTPMSFQSPLRALMSPKEWMLCPRAEIWTLARFAEEDAKC